MSEFNAFMILILMLITSDKIKVHCLTSFSFRQVWMEINLDLAPAIKFPGEDIDAQMCASACLSKLTTCIAFTLDSGCQLFDSPVGFYEVSGSSTGSKAIGWINQDVTIPSTQHLMVVFDDGRLRDYTFDAVQSPVKTYYPQIINPAPRYGFKDGDMFVFVLDDGSMKSVTKGSNTAQAYHPDKPVPIWTWTGEVKGDGVQVGDKFWYVGYPNSAAAERLETHVWSIRTKKWTSGPLLHDDMAHYDLMLTKVDNERGMLCSGYFYHPSWGVGGDARIHIANLTDNTWFHLPSMATYHRDGVCAVVDKDGGKTVLVMGGNVCWACAAVNIGKTYDLSQGDSGTWVDLPASLNYPNGFTVGRLISLNGVAFMFGGYPGPFGIRYLDWDQGWIDFEAAPAGTGTFFPIVIPYKNV